MDLDLEWDVELEHRKGARSRLCGIDVFYEFPWRSVFSDGRAQFTNGQKLAEFVRDRCPAGKRPALLLTTRAAPRQGFHHSPKFTTFVLHIDRYRDTDSNAALSYLASCMEVDIADVAELEQLVGGAAPEVVREFISTSLTEEHIETWAGVDPERLGALRQIAGSAPGPDSTGNVAERSTTLDKLSTEEIRSLAVLLSSSNDWEARLEVARATSSDSIGRRAAAQVVAEGAATRIADARSSVAQYRELLDGEGTTETDMQRFIEGHPWLLGLDYASVRPRAGGPSGSTDFFLQRFDGVSDLLELKSPAEPIIRSPDQKPDAGFPAPHEYKLSSALANALAQALVYRERLTRHASSAEELYGLRQTRDPYLIIVLGTSASLPEHRARVLRELNKSLHRVEIIPYDLLADRAEAALNTIERQLLQVPDEATATDAMPPGTLVAQELLSGA